MSSKATSLKTFHSNAGLNRWFGNDARRWEAKFKRTGVVKNLHVGSGWSYLSDAEFEALTWAPLSLVHPPLRAGATVFEAGVGVGAALRVLLQRVGGLSLAGCDVQPDTLRVARRVLPPGTSLFHCNFSERMPLPDESFDVTASFGALSMYASSVEEMRAGVAELARLARPCGTMVVTQVAPPLPPGRVSGTARLSLPWDFWREAAADVGLTDVRFVAHSDVMRHFGKGHPRFAKSRRFQSERYSVVATKRCAAAAVAASEADHRAEYSTAPSRTTPPTSQHGVRCPAPWSGSASRAGQRLALEKAVAVLASCGAPYLLDNGALLGFWRKCDFLDADLDITVPASWWSIAGNRRCVNVGLPGVGMTSLRARHFGRLRSGAGSVYQESWWLSHNGTINGRGVRLDLTSRWDMRSCSVTPSWVFRTRFKSGGRAYPVLCFLPRNGSEEQSWAGLAVRVPSPTRGYLEAAYGPTFETPDPHWKEDRDQFTIGSCAMAGSRRLPQLASRCGLDVSCETQEAWQSKENFPFGDSVPCTITERAAGVATSLSANLAPCLNVTRGSDTCGNGESTWPTDCSTSVTPHKCRRATTYNLCKFAASEGAHSITRSQFESCLSLCQSSRYFARRFADLCRQQWRLAGVGFVD